MKILINNTTQYQDKSVVSMVKVTCSFSPEGRVEIAKEQKPLVYGDQYISNPENSSIKHASDIVPEKLGSD